MYAPGILGVGFVFKLIIMQDNIKNISNNHDDVIKMETSSALLSVYAGNSPGTGDAVTQSFEVFFDLRLNKQLSKQSWGWSFETLSRPLWRHRNDNSIYQNARSSEYRHYTSFGGNNQSWATNTLCNNLMWQWLLRVITQNLHVSYIGNPMQWLTIENKCLQIYCSQDVLLGVVLFYNRYVTFLAKGTWLIAVQLILWIAGLQVKSLNT